MRNTVAKVSGMVLVLVMVGWVGCGGDSERTPPEKCEDLIAAACARGAQCIPGASGMQSQCVQAVHQTISCSRTKSVTANYEACLDSVHDSSCSALVSTDASSGQVTFKLPAVCASVLVGLAPTRSDTLSLTAEPVDLAEPAEPVEPAGAPPSDAIDELATRAGATLVAPAD